MAKREAKHVHVPKPDVCAGKGGDGHKRRKTKGEGARGEAKKMSRMSRKKGPDSKGLRERGRTRGKTATNLHFRRCVPTKCEINGYHTGASRLFWRGGKNSGKGP